MNNLTLVFFIENEYDELILQKNPLINFSNNLYIFNGFKPKENRGNIIETDCNYYDEIIYTIQENIKTDFFIILNPEETINNIEYIVLPEDSGSFFIKINIETDPKIKQNNLTGLEKRLFSNPKSDSQPKLFDGFQIINYSSRFPYLIKYQENSFFTKYKKGEKDSRIFSFLTKQNLINPTIDEIYEKIDIEINKSKKLDLIIELLKKLYKNNSLSSALDVFFKHENYFKDSVYFNFLRGEVNFRLENYAEAVNYLKTTLQNGKSLLYFDDPFFPLSFIGYSTYYMLGKCLYSLGDIDNSKHAYEQAYKEEPAFTIAKNEYESIFEDNKYQLDFKCQTSGNCCRGFSINVTHVDIKDILKNRPDLTIDDFVEIKNVVNTNDNDIKPYIFENSDIMMILVLKKKKDSMDCLFLENNLCSINDFKPKLCKVWPFDMNYKEGKIRWKERDLTFIKNYCHHTYSKNNVEVEKLKHNLSLLNEDMNEYVEIIKDLNKNPEVIKDKTDFLNFLTGDLNLTEKEKRENVLNDFKNYIYENENVLTLVENPFTSIYQPFTGDRIYLMAFIQDEFFEKFNKVETFKEIRDKFNSLNAYLSAFPELYYRFFINGTHLNLFTNRISNIKYYLYENSKIIFDKTGLSYEYLNHNDLINYHVNKNIKSFKENFSETVKNIERGYFELSYSQLEMLVFKEIKSLLYWLNKMYFNGVDLPFLKYKPENITEFFVTYRNYPQTYEGQIEFAKKLRSIFEQILKFYTNPQNIKGTI